MTTTWHVPDAQLDAFAAGSIDAVHAASVEAHLLHCEVCRAELAGRRPTHDHPAEGAEAVWARIIDEVDRPSRRLAGRSPWAMVTLGTPALEPPPWVPWCWWRWCPCCSMRRRAGWRWRPT